MEQLTKEEIVNTILEELREENTITAGEEQELEIEDTTWRRLSEGDPIKQAVWIKKIMELKGWTQQEAAKEQNLDIPQYQISRYLSVFDLTPKLLLRARNNDIAKTTAWTLAKLPKEWQRKVENRNHLTVKKAKDLCRLYRRRFKNEEDEATEEKVKQAIKNNTQQEETYIGKEPISNKVAWANDPEKPKMKVTCRHCGRTFEVAIERDIDEE